MTISRDGQVSIPAETRSRWNTRRVIVVDLGDRVVMRHLVDDPVSELEAKYRGRGPSSEQARQQARRAGCRPRAAPMIVLDSYAVLAFLKGEAAAPEVRSLLEARDGADLTVVGIAEVLDHLIRIVGVDEEEAALDLAQLDLLGAEGLGQTTAAAAGLLRARHYHRTRCAVSLADCIAAEVTRSLGAVLATSDPHLLDVCHREFIGIHPLTASNGQSWSSSGSHVY